MQNKNHRAAIPNDWKQHEHTHTNVHACCHQGCTAKLADARVANEAITSVNMTTKVRSHHHSYQSTEATCQGQSCQVRATTPCTQPQNDCGQSTAVCSDIVALCCAHALVVRFDHYERSLDPLEDPLSQSAPSLKLPKLISSTADGCDMLSRLSSRTEVTWDDDRPVLQA
mmetsp:Transcript_49345/g.106228  ORF Transcript_49345/g.106228 Transcript_49345/m.106228 type:complete len:170 (-) Transcript_49345:1564-2073(-)